MVEPFFVFRRAFLWAVGVGMLLAALPARADTIRLNNGNVLSGRIVEENDSTLRIDTGQLTLTVLRKNIADVEKGQAADYLLQQGEHALAEGQRLVQQGQVPEARRAFEAALQNLDLGMKDIESPPPALLDLKKRLDEARIDTLPKDPTNQRGEELYRQALTHLDHLEYRKAFELLQEAHQVVPDRPDILLRLGDAARHVNEYDRAVTAYHDVLDMDPATYYAEAGGPLLKLLQQRVQKLAGERRADQAIEVYKEVILLASANSDKPVPLKEYLDRKSRQQTLKEEELLMEVYRVADSNDLIDLAFRAIQRVQTLTPDDPEVKRLVAETRFLTEFKARIDAGNIEEAGALVVEAPPDVVGSDRVAEKMNKFAGDQAATIEAQTLLAQVKAAFEDSRYTEAMDLAAELLRKHPAGESATEATELHKKADFEATVLESLNKAEKLVEQDRDDDAEKELALLLQMETLDQSVQYDRFEALQSRIPREREADRRWIQARDALDEKSYADVRDQLQTLAEIYPGTRSGKRAKDWLDEYKTRLEREIRRYQPTESDYSTALSDPSLWRLTAAPTAPTDARPSAQQVPPVPQERRDEARKVFETIMAADLAGKVERRSYWFHLGLPLAGGVLILVILLWVFARPGSGRLGEAVKIDDGNENDLRSDKPATSPASLCRMCGLPSPKDAPSCPACGTPARLSHVESERALDESRLANLDPWEFRARSRNLNDFEPLFERARDLAEKGIVTAAIETCRRALHEDPHRPMAYAFLAELYERQGRHAEAAQCYREILLLNPADVIARRKIGTLATFSGLPLRAGVMTFLLPISLWWLLFWLVQGLNPGAWVFRAILAAVGAALMIVGWRRYQRSRRRTVPAPHHRGAEKCTPLPSKTLSWREQNRQARLIGNQISEHTGIEVPPLTIWRFLVALLVSLLLLAALVGIAWFNHTPLVLLAWPAGAFVLFYLLEIHPRVVTAHAMLRHLYEETLSPWVDPHRPFLPARMKDRVAGEFLLRSPDSLPLRWALWPFPYRKTRQGLLNSLQQALNRHWEFHRFYTNLRVVRDIEVPMPAGFRTATGFVASLVIVAGIGFLATGVVQHLQKQGYLDAMTTGYDKLLEGDLPAARHEFLAATRLDPDRVAPLLYLAHTESAARLDYAAERTFRAASVRADRIPEAHNDFGNFLQRKGRFREALIQYNLALRQDPDNPDIMNNMGSAYFKLKEYTKAVDYLLPALKANPDHPRAHTTLGLALEGLGDKDRARKAYEMAIRVAPREPYTGVARTRIELDLQPEETSPLRLEALTDNDETTTGALRRSAAGSRQEPAAPASETKTVSQEPGV